MALKDQLDPYGAALNAGLTDAAGRTIDISSPTWYEDFRLARQTKNAERAAAPLPSEVAEAEKRVVGPYKEGIDPADPLHAPNYFAADKIAALTAQERKDYYDTWMRQHSRNYLTPQGDLDFRASARVKENNIFGLVPQATFSEGVKDTALSAYGGLVSGAKSISDVFGTDNFVSEQLGRTLDLVDANKSQEKKVAEVAHSKKIENAKGAWDTTKAVLNKVLEDPVDTLAGAVGSSLPYLIPGTAVARAGATAAKVATALTGAAGGVGATKGSIEEQVKQFAISQGRSPAEAQVLATNAQNYSNAEPVRLILAAGLGAAGSLFGLENAILKAAGSGAAVGKVATSKLAGALSSGAGELVTEAGQSAAEKEAANIASIAIGQMPASERFKGVGEAALEGGIVGFAAGAGFGAAGANKTPATENVATQAINTPATTDSTSTATREKAIADLTKALSSGDADVVEDAKVAAETAGVLTEEEIKTISRGGTVIAELPPKSPAYAAAEAEIKRLTTDPKIIITDEHAQADIDSEFRFQLETALVELGESGKLTNEEMAALDKIAQAGVPPSKEAALGLPTVTASTETPAQTEAVAAPTTQVAATTTATPTPPLTKNEQAATKLLQKVQALEAEYQNFSGNGDGTDPEESGKSYETIDGKRRDFNKIKKERDKARTDLKFLPGFTGDEVKLMASNPQAGLEIIQARVAARTPAATETTQGESDVRQTEVLSSGSELPSTVSGGTSDTDRTREGLLGNRNDQRPNESSGSVGTPPDTANARRVLSDNQRVLQTRINEKGIPLRVTITDPLGVLNSKEGYAAGKRGDPVAAGDAVNETLTIAMIKRLAAEIGDATILPVANFEARESNRLPMAFAAKIAAAEGLPFETRILRKTSDGRTRMDGVSRVFDSPQFAGIVTPGVKYYLLDDTITQGGTVAALARYITANGGIVSGAAVLAGEGRSAILAITPKTLSSLKKQVYKEEEDFYDLTGKRYEDLTESEGRFILKSVGRFRAEVVSRRDGRRDGVPDEALPRGEGSAAPKPAIGHQDPQAVTINLSSLGTAYVPGDALANLITQNKRVTPAQVKLLKTLAPLMTDVKVVSVDPSHPLLNTQAIQADAAYSPTERTIYVANDLPTPVSIVIHEMVHAAVDRVMHTDPAKLNKRQLAARHNIEDTYKFMQNKIEMQGKYGMENVHEFVAEAMSNPEFQEQLAKYKIEKGNFLTRFFDDVKALLGFDAVGKSVLDVVYESTPFMFDAPTERTGETLNAPPRGAPMYDKFSKYGAQQKKRAGTKTTQGVLRNIELWGEENFIDHGARGESQIIDEMEATDNPELKTALRNVQQDITLRDMMGESARLAKIVIDPVEANIRKIAKEDGIDPNDLRHEAGLLAVAQHSFSESEKEIKKLEAAVETTQEILDNHDALKSIITAHEEEYRKLNRRLEDFHDGRTRGHREISQATLSEIKDDASSLLAKFITDMSHVEFKASPRGEARTLIAKALTDRVYSAKSSIGATKILEGLKLFMRDMETMIDPKDRAKHAHQEAVENLALWNEAQTNPRVEANDGTGRLITANGLKVPGGYLMSEAKEIIDAADDARHSAAGEIRNGFKKLTEEAVKAGILTQQEADTYAAEFPYYVNTQGQSDAEKDDNFLERNLKGYMAPAEGSNHMGNSNDVFSNLIIRNDALAKNISNQKLGTSLATAIKAGSGLFEYGIPYTGSTHAEKARTYVRVQDGAKVRYITPTTDAGQKMLGLHPNRRAYAGLNRVAQVTSAYGRLVTFFAPAHGPITLIRDIPTRIFNLVGRKKDLIAEDGRMLNVYKVRAGVAAQAMNPKTILEAAKYALTGKPGESMAEFKTTGGYQTFVDRITSEDQVDRRFASGYKTWAGNSWEGLNNVVRRWNNIFETWSTLASYKGMRTAGMSPKQSGYVTLAAMNFRKTGEVTGRYMRPLYMFANATAQDLGETRKALFYRGKVNWQGIIEMSALVAAGSMLYSLSRSEDDDDELGGKKMDALSSGDVYKNILIPKGNGEYWRIPVAFGAVQAMYQIGVATNRSEAGLITPAEALADSFAGIVKIGSLTGGSETPFLDKPAIWAAQMVSPSLIRPITNTALGVNFAGSPVTTTLQADKFKSEQGKFNTPEAYKTFVKGVRETMGADFSPEDAKNLVEGYLIGPAKVALDEYIDVTGDKEMKGLDKETDTSALMRILAANRFMSVTDEGKIAQTAFYKLTREARELEKQFNASVPKKFDGKSENRQQKMARYASAGMTPEQADLLEAYKAYEKAHDPLKKQIRGVQEEALEVDRSDILQSLAAQEAAMMTDFVKTVRGTK